MPLKICRHDQRTVHYLLTVSERVVVLLVLPLVPMMVMVRVPVVARELAVNFTVDVPEPGAPMDDGVKLTVTPDASPVAVKAIAELKPPVAAVVMVDVPLLPRTIVTDVGEAEMVKLGGAGAVTVRVIVAVLLMPPPEPVTVIG